VEVFLFHGPGQNIQDPGMFKNPQAFGNATLQVGQDRGLDLF
jgi:hypothetical protein